MRTFKALIADKTSGEIKRKLGMKNTQDLSASHVLIKVKYSCLNYYDILTLKGDPQVHATYPIVPGIDAAGIVAESASYLFKEGDEVIVTGYGLGTETDGGFGQYIQVPENWVINLPTGLSLKDAMTIGTEGLSAAIAVMEITSAGINGNSKNIAITGASVGTGAFATGILSMIGHNVTAITSLKDNNDFIKNMGASEIIKYEDFIKTPHENRYAGAIDTLGGEALKILIMSLENNGSAALCGTLISDKIDMPIDKIISGGINIIGIDAVNCPKKLRLAAWYSLAGEWYLKTLPWLCDEIALMDIEEYIEKTINRNVKGRIVINHDM